MKLTFADLATLFPPGSIELVGNSQMKVNMTLISGQQLTLDSSILEPLSKFMQGLADLTSAINAERGTLNPPKSSIQFVSHSFDGTPENPEIIYEYRVAVSSNSFVENLFDPTSN